MKIWKKGAIMGAVWGLLGIIPYSYVSTSDNPLSKILFTLLGFPAFVAITMNIHFIFIFISSPIIGIIIGAGIGYMIDNLKDDENTKEEKYI